MKRKISQTAAIFAAVTATTFAAQLTYADLAGSAKGSSGSVINAAQSTSNIVAGVVVKAGGSIMMVSEKSSDALVSLAQGASDATLSASQKAFVSAKGVVVKGFAISQKTSTLVLDFSHADKISAAAKSVVTAGGALISSTLNSAGTAIGVSVKTTSTAVSTVSDSSGKAIIGTVKWASNTSAVSGKFLMNAAGELLDASGQVIGWVVDATGDILNLAVNTSGKLATVAGQGSEVIITGSADALKSTAQAISAVVQHTGAFASDVFEASMKVSKLGSLVVVTISEKATGSVTGSVRFTSQTIANLFDSMASKQSQN